MSSAGSKEISAPSNRDERHTEGADNLALRSITIGDELTSPRQSSSRVHWLSPPSAVLPVEVRMSEVTKTLAALQRLLDRGGVIAGRSAGVQVQSSFMTRGDYTRRGIVGDKKLRKVIK